MAQPMLAISTMPAPGATREISLSRMLVSMGSPPKAAAASSASEEVGRSWCSPRSFATRCSAAAASASDTPRSRPSWRSKS